MARPWGACHHSHVPDTCPAEVHIELMGPPRWRSARHAELPLSPRDAALLALLALDGEQPRERLAAWLWPDAPPKNAAINLRQHLFKLRKTCGHALFADGPRLRLADGVTVDVRQTPPPLDGRLLDGWNVDGVDAFSEWLRSSREQLDNRRRDHWAGQAEALESRQELAAAIALAERIVCQWPLHEHSWRRLMRLHYLRGDRAAAIDAFERFERLVRDEQGSRPAAETLALLDSIERLQSSVPTTPHLPACLQHPPQLVGRADTLLQLHQAWHLGRAVLLLGEGGIGKTRLLSEFLQGRRGVLLRRARAGEAASPYATLVLLLRELLATWQPELDAETRVELARLLPGFGPPPSASGQQPLLWQAVEQLLRAAHALGLQAVVVDDLHHADAASIELLRWLQASPDLAGLRFAFAARPAEPASAVQLSDWAGDSSRVERLRLGPLDLAQLRELLLSLPVQLPATESPLETQAEALYRHAGGHPFYTLETLKAVLRQAGAASPWPAPASAQAMIERSLQQLTPAARDLAALAALAAGDWHPELAAALLLHDAHALLAGWAELEQAQLMSGRAFAHDLVREVAFQLQPAAWRLGQHGRLAQALAGRADADPARVAEHWWAAERWSEAAEALRRAAAQARVAGRLTEHVALLDRAADAAGRAGDAATRFEALADAASASMMSAGTAAFDARLHDLAPLVERPLQQARLDLLWTENLINRGQYALALQRSDRALSLAPPGSPLHHDARVLHGHALTVNGRGDDAVPHLRWAADDAAARGHGEQESNARAGLAHALHSRGELTAALQAQQRVLALALTRHSRDEIAHAAASLATTACSATANALGLTHARQADTLFSAMGARGMHWVWNRITLARCAMAVGRFDQAWEALDVLDDSVMAVAGRPAQVLVAVTRATAQLWLGRPDLALQTLPAWPQHDASCLPMAQARLRTVRAQALVASGESPASELALLAEGAEQTPSLRDDPVIALDWCCLMEPLSAIATLRRLRAQAQSHGVTGMARSLAVREVQRLLGFDRPAARELALATVPGLPDGVHASLCPAEAWALLAQALDGKASRTCLQQAQAWVQQSHLPEPASTWRPAAPDGAKTLKKRAPDTKSSAA